MRYEKWGRSLTGALLAFAVSYGAVGCLLTGFDLNVVNPAALWLVCGGAAFLWSALSSWKWGSAAGLCLLAAWAGFLWRRGDAGEQLLQVLYRISYAYDRAYGWGALRFVDTPWNMATADIPLRILGCIIAIAACRTVCRGKRTWPAVAVSLVPLLLCLVVTDTVPEEKYLFLLLTGLTLLLLSAAVRRMDTQQAARLIVLLALPVALALGLLFRSVPQNNYVNQSEEVREKILTWVESLPEKAEDAARQVASSVSGSEDETVNLKTLGRQSSLAYPVMEVTSDWGGALYLREWDYDSYTGTGWTATPHRAEEFFFAGEDAGMVRIETRSGRETRFLPYYPQGGTTLVGGSLTDSGREKEYSLTRTVLPDNWRGLVKERSEGVWESEIVFTAALNAAKYLDSARYLLLPTGTQKQAEVLLETILYDQSTATAKADAIAAYVRNSAQYSRDTGRMPPDAEDFALWFLEDGDTGYCVHFATAAVVLLRAADIPARYVTGYMVTCQPGETVTVTADTAHAWAEYYEPQLACWIPLEATPAEGLPQTVRPEETTRQTQPTQTTPTRPEQTEPEKPEPTVQQTLPTGTVSQQGKRTISIPWGWLLMAAAVMLQRPVRIALRRRRRKNTPNARALGYWQEIELLSKLRGVSPPPEMEALAQKAKFSQHTLSRQELAEMENYIHSSVEELKDRPWYQRLVHRLIFAAY